MSGNYSETKPETGEEKITVTPAMVEAGLDAFAGFNEDYDMREDLVTRVFIAMSLALVRTP